MKMLVLPYILSHMFTDFSILSGHAFIDRRTLLSFVRRLLLFIPWFFPWPPNIFSASNNHDVQSSSHVFLFVCFFHPKKLISLQLKSKVMGQPNKFSWFEIRQKRQFFFIWEIINVSRKVFYWERFQFWKSEENCPIIRFWKIFM